MYEPITLVDGTAVLTNGDTNAYDVHAIAQQYAFSVNVTVAGAAGSLKIQGSLDGTNWKDLGYITDASDTISQTAISLASTGVSVLFVSNPVARRYRFFRVDTSGISGSPKAVVQMFSIV